MDEVTFMTEKERSCIAPIIAIVVVTSSFFTFNEKEVFLKKKIVELGYS